MQITLDSNLKSFNSNKFPPHVSGREGLMLGSTKEQDVDAHDKQFVGNWNALFQLFSNIKYSWAKRLRATEDGSFGW